jgi:uncharacterized protein (TIGR00299 family) protein
VLYFDCFSGISGDMVLGAFLDAGLPLDALRDALGSLAVPAAGIGRKSVMRSGISATQFILQESARDPVPAGTLGRVRHMHDHVHAHRHDHTGGSSHTHDLSHHHDSVQEHPHRTLREIFDLIATSGLSPTGRERATMMFQRLAEAEARIHQLSVNEVHLHEVGALDSIIDIVGAVFALEWVGADRVVCSPLNVGGGFVHTAHGELPVPAPATVALLGDAPIYGDTLQQELVTPTGALIVTSYAKSFGPVPAMEMERVGYGAGERDTPGRPNVLRLLIGRSTDRAEAARVTVVECEIDDMNPQLFGVVMDRLYAAGALDVFYVPVQMKKGRPGTLLTVVAPPGLRSVVADIVFRETTTIGLRYFDVDRECLRREIVTVETPVGSVRFKLAWREGRIINAAPEFEDCARLATEKKLAVKDVQAIALQAYGSLQSRPS